MLHNSNSFQFIKFIFIGGINTLFGFSIYVFFIWYGLNYSIALAISIFFGVIFNYFSTGRVVFNHSKFDRIFAYLSSYLFVYIVNISLISMLLLSGLNEIEAGFIALFALSLVMYFLIKKYVYY